MENYDYLKIYEEVYKTSEVYNYIPATIEEILKNPAYSGPFYFLMSKIKKDEKIIDIGTGRGILINVILNYFKKNNITCTDISKFYELDVEFIKIDLTKDLNKLEDLRFDALTCTNVLEHIEEEFIDSILLTFSKIARFSALTIANHEDVVNGYRLHINNQKMDYWENKLNNYFNIIEKSVYYPYEILFYFGLESKNFRR